MKIQSLFFVATILLTVSACSKAVHFPEPVIILEYTTDSSSFSRTETVTSNRTLLTAAGVNWGPAQSADSIILSYGSSVFNGSNNVPNASITITKAYSKNDLEAYTVDGFLRYRPKTDELFNDAFKTGKLKVSWYNGPDYDFTGAAFFLSTGPTGYTSSPSQPILNAPDTINDISITNATRDINWLTAYSNIPNMVDYSSRNIMVTFNYKCRVYNTEDQSVEKIVTGKFQSYYVDRN